jgi:hypothetical protein
METAGAILLWLVPACFLSAPEPLRDDNGIIGDQH